MDEDWRMELAVTGGGVDPRNPCPKCGTIPHAPGDGSGRSCQACGWSWMVGMRGGRYTSPKPRDTVLIPGEPHIMLVHEAARRYRWRVEDAASVAEGQARRTLRELAKTLLRAEADPTAIRLSNGLLDLEAWREIEAEPELRTMLVNEYSLGLGDIRAPVVVMGTEAADDLTKPEELAYQCIFPLVVLAGGRSDVADSLLAIGNWTNPEARYPVHIAPWDYYGKPSKGRNTWRLVSEAVSARPYLENIGRTRLDIGLGARAYQIERSAASAQKARNGMPPSPERIDFLAHTFLPAVASTARVLLMHGFGSPWPAWKERSNRIASAFLGQDPAFEWTQREDKAYLEVKYADDGRVVIWCRALSTNVADDLIREIRGHVLRAAPE